MAYSAAGTTSSSSCAFAMISVNLAVINFLPIPSWTAGTWCFSFMKSARGPASENIRAATYAGLFIILTLMAFVWVDISRWFRAAFSERPDRQSQLKTAAGRTIVGIGALRKADDQGVEPGRCSSDGTEQTRPPQQSPRIEEPPMLLWPRRRPRNIPYIRFAFGVWVAVFRCWPSAWSGFHLRPAFPLAPA